MAFQSLVGLWDALGALVAEWVTFIVNPKNLEHRLRMISAGIPPPLD